MSKRNKLDQKKLRKAARQDELPIEQRLCLASPRSGGEAILSALAGRNIHQLAKTVRRSARRATKVQAILATMHPNSRFRPAMEHLLRVHRFTHPAALREVAKRTAPRVTVGECPVPVSN